MLKVLFLILAVMCSVAFAQTPKNKALKDNPKAYIFAELGKANNAEVTNQYQKFDDKLNNDSNSQGYIINYGTDKEVTKREKQLRDALSFRKDDRSRVTFVRADKIGKLKTVFWIVPEGAEPPKP